MKLQKQEDIRDCGIAILQAYYFRFYNEWININSFKSKVTYGKKGVNISALSKLAEDFGMALTPMKGKFNALKSLIIDEPIIALTGNEHENHFIVITKIKNQKVYYIDPISGGSIIKKLSEFKFQFLDVIIYVKKTGLKKFKKVERNIIEPLLKYKTKLPLLFMSSILSIIFNMTSSLLLKFILDKVIPSGMHNTLLILLLGFSTMGVLGVFNHGIRNFIIYKIYLSINFKMFNEMNHRLKNSKLKELDKLTKVDILRRMGLIDTISLFISSTFFSLFTDFATLLISVSVMFILNLKLTLICFMASACIVLITLINQSIINKKYDTFIKKQLDFNTDIFDMVNTIQKNRKISMKKISDIKIFKTFYDFKKIDYSIWSINNTLDIIEEVISLLIPITIIGISTNLVIENKMTVGTMLLFLSMFGFFIGPLKAIVELVIKYPLIKKEFDMLDFLMNLEIEKTNPKGLTATKIDVISFKNFSFSYEQGNEILKQQELNLEESFRLTGKNGTGKSTLLNVLNFNYICDGIYVNGMNTKYYSLDSLRELVYTNQPDDYFPHQTILEFATMGEPKIIEEFMKNIERNGVLELMENKKISLTDKMLNNADNLSSGQKQIVKLLPLFGRNYSLILLDEALENIDKDARAKLKTAIIEKQKYARFIEISHTGKFLRESKELRMDEFK